MNNIFDVYQSISESIEELDDFRIYDFIYYLGINSVDRDIPREEIARLINVCKECSDNFIDTFKLARLLTSLLYKDRSMSLEQLERVPSNSIKYLYSEERLNEMKYYFESYEEIITSPKTIMQGFSYTVARVIHDGYCVELHYCSDRGATIEYGAKTAHDTWENEIEDADWFNTNLSDDYILNRLKCLYDEEFSNNKLADDRAKELNLIDHILAKYKVDDIDLYINDNGDLLAFDDSNYWKNNDFYDFMFNELFVYNSAGQVELINESDYKKIEEYRKQYKEPVKEIEMEM